MVSMRLEVMKKHKPMKLAAIYNVWDGVELLEASMATVLDHVDLIIIVWQDVSNYGEKYNPMAEVQLDKYPNVVKVKYSPADKTGPGVSERDKRNLGLDIARQHKCTHFLHMDTDEFYMDFEEAKREYIRSGVDGSVVPILTYFKRPTYRLENYDNYFVPFIHKLHKRTQAGVGTYPFYVDPTRKVNAGGVRLLREPMHHMSWVRKDIKRKIRNSTARKNIDRSKLLRDYLDENTGPGTILEDYQNQVLIEVPDNFNLSGLFSY